MFETNRIGIGGIEVNELEYYSSIKNMVSAFIGELDLKPSELDEQSKQILATFCFGMINGFSLKNHIDPVKVQGSTIEMLINTFHYSPSASAEFCQFLIECTDKSFHPTMHAIIHRGIEGYFQYEEGKTRDLVDNIQDVLTIVKNG